MKIAFITRSLAGGGAERVVSVLANSLSENKEVSEVDIISIIEDKVTYPVNDKVKYYANASQRNGKINRVFQRYSFLRKYLKKVNPDIVISFCTQINIYSILANHGMKGKLIISERNDPNRDPVQAYVRKLRNLIYKLCKNAVFQTPDAKAYFKNIIKGKKTVIMNPIKNNLPDQFVGKRENRIVSVARLTDVKNHDLLIKAFSNILKKHPDYNLEIYGEGPEKDNLQNLIKRLGIADHVFLKGFVNNVHGEIVSAACFVLPSNYEGISNSMIEALGMGIPSVCTDCPIGGARMMIENGVNGLLVPVGDQQAIENAICRIIEDQEFSDKLSLESVKIKDKLTPEKISREWMNFIKSI